MNITTASEHDTLNPQEKELASLLARRELWLLVCAGHVDPYHGQRLNLLQDRAFRRRTTQAALLVGQEHPAIELGRGEIQPSELSPQGLFTAFDDPTESIEASYRGIFGLAAISPQCPACEVEFEPNGGVFYRSQQLADIAGFYKAFGVELTERGKERVDHITVEAEFLYLLLAKEALAVEDGNREGAAICQRARRTFFQEHVGWWLPTFARVLSRLAAPGYYRQLAYLTAAVSALERASLKLPPFKTPISPNPSPLEAQATCFECINRSDQTNS